MKVIRVLYHPRVDYSVRRIVQSTIEETFTLKVAEGELRMDISSTYNKLRGQYNAEGILYLALSNYEERPILVVVPFDIYVEGLNFVFGVAIRRNGAVIGLERFRYGNNFAKRLEKTVKHELGHVFGLSHCNNPCVMRFANSLYELDIKPEYFCTKCARRLIDLGLLKRPSSLIDCC